VPLPFPGRFTPALVQRILAAHDSAELVLQERLEGVAVAVSSLVGHGPQTWLKKKDDEAVVRKAFVEYAAACVVSFAAAWHEMGLRDVNWLQRRDRERDIEDCLDEVCRYAWKLDLLPIRAVWPDDWALRTDMKPAVRKSKAWRDQLREQQAMQAIDTDVAEANVAAAPDEPADVERRWPKRGEFFDHERIARGLSREGMAAKAGVSAKTLRPLFKGEKTTPDTVKKALKALNSVPGHRKVTENDVPNG
jgi:hypothetical protein